MVASVGMGFCAVVEDTNNARNITISSGNLNLQDQTSEIIHNTKDPGKKTVPLQKTGVPIVPVLLSTLMVGSGLLYERLRK